MKKLGQASRSYAKSLQNTDIRSEPVQRFPVIKALPPFGRDVVGTSPTIDVPFADVTGLLGIGLTRLIIMQILVAQTTPHFETTTVRWEFLVFIVFFGRFLPNVKVDYNQNSSLPMAITAFCKLGGSTSYLTFGETRSMEYEVKAMVAAERPRTEAGEMELCHSANDKQDEVWSQLEVGDTYQHQLEDIRQLAV